MRNETEKSRRRVLLLSSPTKPFGPGSGDSFSCQTSGSHQLTWAQDIFRVEDQMWHWGLDVIAKNIDIPTTVLHYPTLNQFTRELRNGYDYVGLSFNLATLHKVESMVRAVRKFSPGSKVVLGGYGTVLPDDELKRLGDYICREEGIQFMRRLLQESEKPFVNPDFVVTRRILSLGVERIGIIFSSVGCPMGCDFCCTSHFYKRKKIYFYKTGGELVDAIISLRRSQPSVSSTIIFDDDFLIDKQRATQFLEAARESKKHLNVMVFASVKSLSQFSARDIAEMGITKIWIGFEGVKAGYEKQKGKAFDTLLDELRYYGISTTASMMIGFDYQTKDIIKDELQQLVCCSPTATQIILVTPCVGTPLWEKLSADRRLIENREHDYKLHDGFTSLFIHPRIVPEELEELQRELYSAEYELLGPSIFRVLYTQFQGYKNLKDDENTILRERAEAFLRNLKRARIFYKLGINCAPNDTVREQLRRQYTEITAEIGDLNMPSRLAQYFLRPLVWWTRLRFKRNLFLQPRYQKRTYNI